MAIQTFTRIILTCVLLSTLTLLQGQSIITASVNTPGGAGILSENCGGPYELVIRRGADNTTSTIIFISDAPGGVAQAGIDYNFPPGSFPVNMLPADSIVIIPILVVNDGTPEGLETLIWELAYDNNIESGFINPGTAITDDYSVEINSTTDTIVWCRDVPYVLQASSDAEIHWTPADVFDDAEGEAATVRPQESGWYYAEVGSESCGAKDSIYFNLGIVEIIAGLGDPDTVFICLDGPGVELFGVLEGPATEFTWIPTDSLSNPEILNPLANPVVTTTYILQSDLGVCVASDRIVVRVDSIPDDLHIDIAPFKPYYCAGETVVLFSPSYDSLLFPDLAFRWTPFNTTFTSKQGLLNAALILQDTTTYVRENLNNACISSDTIVIDVVPSGIPISVTDTILCPGATFQVTVLSDQVTEPEWTPKEGLSCTKCLDPIVTVIGVPGTLQSYQFSGMVRECPVSANLNIIIPDIQTLNISSLDPVVCAGDTTTLTLLNPDGLFNYSWTITGGDGSLSCNNCTNPVLTVNSDGGVSISVSASVLDHTKHCGAMGNILLTAGEILQDNTNVLQACLGNTVVATLDNPNYTDVQWSSTNPNISLSCTNCPNPVVTVNAEGSIQFTAEINDPDVCKVTGRVSVSNFEPDVANIIITPDPALGLGVGQGTDVMATLAVTPTPTSIMWTVNGVSIPVTTATFTFNASEVTNVVTATFINSNGCEQVVTFTFETKPPEYKIPNAFTPDNGDENNDNFKIIIVGNIQIHDFMIFNRWGQLVYKGVDNDSIGWDGMFKNQPAASDTYVYKATLRFPDGRAEIVKGDVILLR
ncbi:MAG TPA: T9SS type B sorting domain-containing protein [Saprospiraceae bacterium]|nr:T9SS type B sorting domain-containing protein [Saprospiraceae bacterium]